MQIADIYGNLPELTSQRLILRKITMADLEDRFQFLSDEQGTRFLPFAAHTSRGQTADEIGYIENLYATGQLSPWGITDKETGRCIGTIGYGSWRPRHGRAELYYNLAREAWGRGLATEAARTVLQFGFERMELNRVEALIDPENAASRGVAAKMGMTEEGLLRESFNIDGAFRDHLMYAVLRREWAQHKSEPR